jgi:hypothetical protein
VNVSSGRGLPLLVDGDEEIIAKRIREILT